MESSDILAGKGGRAAVDSAENSEEVPGNQEKRRCVGDLRLAFVVDAGAAEGQAQWRNPDSKARWGATHASAAEGADAGTSA